MAMEEVVTIEETRAAGKQDREADNTALKSVRVQGEEPEGTPESWTGVDLCHQDTYLVLTVKRDKASAFTMVQPLQPWCASLAMASRTSPKGFSVTVPATSVMTLS